MTYLIYKHTNKFNDKSYIGQTSQKATRRWRNGSGYKESPIFYAAIKKYGFDNFSHEILEENIATKSLANEREQYWIQYYHTWIYDSACQGYNSTQGGTCNNTTSLQKPVYQLDEHKNILATYTSISEAAMTMNVSPDRITRCCHKQKGYLTAGGYYWCLVDDYSSYLISIKHIKQPKALKGRKTRTVYRVDTDEIVTKFLSVSEAAKSIGVERTQISAACRSKSHYLHDYYWYYEEQYKT